ncbi:DUF302 domain-containing protein [bacterium SCSIO 12643]|nr:DUF302 domain-containing protein [bacterium SCSIO 12643]
MQLIRNFNLSWGVIVLSILTLIGCQSPEIKEDIYSKVDAIQNELKQQEGATNFWMAIDHSRLAAQVDVYTPPSIVTFFNDPQLNSSLIQENPLIALDLPLKVLCYSEPDTQKVSIAYTSADFIARRHNVSKSDLEEYDERLNGLLSEFPDDLKSRTSLKEVDQNYGITFLKSDFGFDSTILRLKEIIGIQGDTRWFGEIDYQKDAVPYGIELKPLTLLLFGGPGPGGKAMHDSPKLGLDAFCQKLLVYENENQEIIVAYNDIEDFAQLYYGRSTPPQKVINKRLRKTFEMAIKRTS